MKPLPLRTAADPQGIKKKRKLKSRWPSIYKQIQANKPRKMCIDTTTTMPRRNDILNKPAMNKHYNFTRYAHYELRTKISTCGWYPLVYNTPGARLPIYKYLRIIPHAHVPVLIKILEFYPCYCDFTSATEVNKANNLNNFYRSTPLSTSMNSSLDRYRRNHWLLARPYTVLPVCMITKLCFTYVTPRARPVGRDPIQIKMPNNPGTQTPEFRVPPYVNVCVVFFYTKLGSDCNTTRRTQIYSMNCNYSGGTLATPTSPRPPPPLSIPRICDRRPRSLDCRQCCPSPR